MFKLRLAEYINAGLQDRGMTYKEFSTLSGVPVTTLHSYAQGRVNNPDEDNLARIAKAFGDDPEVIRTMRREEMASTARENILIARSDDKALMEQLAGLIRSNMLEVLEAYKAQAIEQQAQIIAHADERVEKVEARCAEQIRQIEANWAEKMDMQRRHDAELLEAERAHQIELRARNASTRDYLKTMVRNLSLALGILSSLCITLGIYGAYALAVFDKNDPMRGLIQQDGIGAAWQAAALVLIASAGIGVLLFRLLRRKTPEAEHAEKTE